MKTKLELHLARLKQQIVPAKDKNLLPGGDGNDTYTFTDDYGIDIVTDSDGSGLLQVDAQTLNGGKNLAVLKEYSKNRIVVNGCIRLPGESSRQRLIPDFLMPAGVVANVLCFNRLRSAA